MGKAGQEKKRLPFEAQGKPQSKSAGLKPGLYKSVKRSKPRH
jgi:hypothetical protein